MANRYDVNALDNVLNAAAIPAYAGEYKTPSRSTLREYRESGALSRGTLRKMDDVRGEMAKIQPEINKYNAQLEPAKAAAGEYKTAATNYNTSADSLQGLYDRYNNDPGNSGLLKAGTSIVDDLHKHSDAALIASRKIAGGEAINYSKDDENDYGNKYYKAPVHYTNTGEYDPATDYTVPIRQWHQKDAARPKMELSSTELTARSDAAVRASDAAAAATKHDAKRYEANQGGLLQSSTPEQQTSNSPFESQFSSLAKYRKG